MTSIIELSLLGRLTDCIIPGTKPRRQFCCRNITPKDILANFVYPHHLLMACGVKKSQEIVWTETRVSADPRCFPGVFCPLLGFVKATFMMSLQSHSCPKSKSISMRFIH